MDVYINHKRRTMVNLGSRVVRVLRNLIRAHVQPYALLVCVTALIYNVVKSRVTTISKALNNPN